MKKKDNQFNEEQIEKTKRAFQKNPNYKTKSGYTGNRKSISERKKQKQQKKTYSKKQRQLDGLSRKQGDAYWKMQNQLDQWFQKHSNISRKASPGEEKDTKKDSKKGLKAEGLWSISQYKQYMKHNKTFIKYCVKEHNVRNFRDIKPGMVVSYVEHNLEKGNSAATIRKSYLPAIKKLGELGSKEGIKSFSKLVPERAREICPEYKKENYRRGKEDGYSIKNVQVMAKKAEEHFSPLHRTAIETLGFAGPRIEEFTRIKWRHLDFESNQLYLTDPNQTKGDRGRFVPMPEKTMSTLKNIYNLGLHGSDDERIWGNKMTQNDVRDFVKECARLGKQRYSGVHDFRRSTLEFQEKRVKKDMDKKLYNKSQLADKVLEHVNVPGLNLNPLEPVKEPKRDKNGKMIFKQRKDGHRYPVLQKVKDENGQFKMERRYTKEKLMNYRTDKLINMYLSQVLGHNRTDCTSIYRKTKKESAPKEETTEKKSDNK